MATVIVRLTVLSFAFVDGGSRAAGQVAVRVLDGQVAITITIAVLKPLLCFVSRISTNISPTVAPPTWGSNLLQW